MIPDPPKSWFKKIPYYLILGIFIGGNYLVYKWEERKELDSIPKEK